MTPDEISSSDRHQTWRTIHMGTCAAIRSVRQEFKLKPNVHSSRDYIESLENGKNNTQFLISVKGTHHPLKASSVPVKAFGPSLIKVIFCTLKLHRDVEV